MFKPSTGALIIAMAFNVPAHAEQGSNLTLDEVVVSASSITTSGLSKKELARKRNNSSDSTRLLGDQPGISLNSAGGVSSIPAIHGMSDDRLRVQVDGMDLISACANHMNPPLSYMDPTRIDKVMVFAGISPVSVGGDSIGGTIQVVSSTPVFAETGAGMLLKGEVGASYRSNNAAQAAHASATIANEAVSLRYDGSTVKAGTYKAGADFKAAATSAGTLNSVYVAGNEVASSEYQSNNQSVSLNARSGNHRFELGASSQNIPYQGFPNQYMDMLKNNSQQYKVKYVGGYDWGKLQAAAYNERTQHYMNFLDAKNTSAAGMPMDTDGKNTGVSLKGDINLADGDVLRLGSEIQQYRLDDWWNPASTAANGMMSPNTFWNINNGQRDRLALFSEWETRLSPEWAGQFGLRGESVNMNTGNVQGYNNANMTAASMGMMGMTTNYLAESTAFNALDHQRTDTNIDITALGRYTPDTAKSFEIGLAQKTRSPNLYERYTWSSTSMSMKMVNWVGDGNGYLGNINLKPEIARTLSGSMSFHGTADDGFEVKLAPYYTLVENYIDAERCATGVACTAANKTATTGFVYLQFVNQNAQLLGADMSARLPLADAGLGKLSANGVVSYSQGKNLTTGDNLYHIMPLNMKLALEQRRSNWTNSIELKLVDAKTAVSAVRNELATSGYGLLNLYSSYTLDQVRFDMGIENLLDKFYYDPMGGSYLGQKAQSYGTSVPGMGRSFNASVTVQF